MTAMRIIIRTYLVCLLLASTTVHAAEWTIDPTIRFRAGYDDNVRLRTNNKVSSAEATLSPGAVSASKLPRQVPAANWTSIFIAMKKTAI